MKITLFITVLFISALSAYSQQKINSKEKKPSGSFQKEKIVFSDNFIGNLDNWIAEFEKPGTSRMEITDGKLNVSASAGATVWFKNKLSGNVMIVYYATVVDAGGENDRISDLNAFWMATNPSDKNLFTLDGKFSSYDKLNLYYAGVGGHDNEITRFRKYEGNKDKAILKEYTDKEHLLVGNQQYSIKIIVNNGLVQYFLNDKLYWEYQDKSPYKEGYFGFRTFKSHQMFGSFKVLKIE